jgi:hypothetical protein
MTTRTRAIILLLALGAFLVLGCQDWDINRTGLKETATASVWTEAEVRATAVVAERRE